MSKAVDVKKIAEQLINNYGEIECRKIIKELQKILDLCIVKVYFSGSFDEQKKEIVSNWIKNKVKGHYEIEYIQDENLISGLKIVYKDFDYEDSLVSDLRKLVWNK